MKHYRQMLLATLTLLFGLHILRAFLPVVIWFLGQYLPAEQLALFALAIFLTPLLTPLLRRWLREPGALALTVGGVAVTRLLLQFANAPLPQLILATLGLILWGWFIPLWQTASRNRSDSKSIPVLGIALPLAFLLDTGSRTLLFSYDLVWRQGWWPALIVIALAGLVLAMLRQELRAAPSKSGLSEPALSRTWPFLALGPFLYLGLAMLHSPAGLSVMTGWGVPIARLSVNGFLALGALMCVWAAGWPARPRWLAALLTGLLLVMSLQLLSTPSPLAGLWFGLAVLSLWTEMGWILTGVTGVPPARPGLWRTSLATFLALLLMLVIVFMVGQYDLSWMALVAGMIVGSSAIGATIHGAGRASAAPNDFSIVGGVAAIVLVIVGGRTIFYKPPGFTQPVPVGETLRVMTYNIHQGVDADLRVDLAAIAEAIAEQQPDVVALNEVNRARATNGFIDLLPYLSDRLGMPYVFGANSSDWRYGNAILSRYPIVEWDNTHYVHNTTEVRGLLRATILTPLGSITFYATHLDHLAGPNNARQAQVSEALALWGGNPASILLGDLNATPDTTELQAIYQAGFRDALSVAGREDSFTFWDPTPTPGRRIDYIFVTPDLQVGEVWVPQTRASDHLPVVAEIRK